MPKQVTLRNGRRVEAQKVERNNREYYMFEYGVDRIQREAAQAVKENDRVLRNVRNQESVLPETVIRRDGKRLKTALTKVRRRVKVVNADTGREEMIVRVFSRDEILQAKARREQEKTAGGIDVRGRAAQRLAERSRENFVES